MNQHTEQDIQRLMHLPWTILREVTPEGDVLLRVKEIPSAVGSGDSDEERIEDLWESLSESLRALLHFGDPVPLPEGVNESWTRIPQPMPKQEVGFYFVRAQNTSTAAAALPVF